MSNPFKNMGIDQVKVWFTYGIISFVVVFGLFFLYSIRAETEVQNGAVALAIVSFIGMGLQFLTGQVVQSQTAHQTNVAATTLTGTNGHSAPTTVNAQTATVNGGDPTIVNPSESSGPTVTKVE